MFQYSHGADEVFLKSDLSATGLGSEKNPVLSISSSLTLVASSHADSFGFGF